MGISMHTVSKSQVVEDSEGIVVSFSSSESGSGSNKETSGIRVGDELIVRTNTVKKKRIDMPKSVMGPYKADKAMRALEIKAGTKATFNTFAAQFPDKPVDIHVDIIGKEDKVVREGQPAQSVWHMRTSLSILPVPMDMYCDDDLNLKLGVMRMPGLGEMRVVAVSREEALQKITGSELMVSSFIEPNKPLKDYKRMKSATYRITTKDQASDAPTTMQWADGGSQKVLSHKPGETILQITVPEFDEKAATWKLPYSGSDNTLRECLAPTQFIEITPQIRELAKQAVGDETNPVLAARKIQRFVRKYIGHKDFSVGFASADETATSRTGDCTEHGVLCAAMARAVGLPARVVTGLGYMPTNYDGTGSSKNGSFGFHMWAEAWVGPGADDWIPMDAALGSFDIGHMAITRTALTSLNPMIDVGMPIMNMMGNLQIEVQETVLRDKAKAKTADKDSDAK
ncbi:hypothetical protein DB346_12725 [Verrucomicrobia bacterium LW23]|nr:hypothetical protein DB346_12725 [Verrucomicrobia bacterium LW23]